ncbi:MAG: AmmeMemoRadiSam system protein B [Candidatus Omnitrophica bacterium]|nr:AmmeMemoRadiSam system protein B [Candidatus Omnitrophota bacterium]
MEDFKIRKPAVAGQFYPSDIRKLKDQIEDYVLKDAYKRDVIACILPHAGYIYSGRVAAETLSYIQIKERIIIFGPNHTGYGKPFGIMNEGIWQMPFGDIEIDKDLADELLKSCKYLEEDSISHLYEHSLEVEMPFLQYFRKDFKIVPITVALDDLELYKEIGSNIADTIDKLGIRSTVLIVASSDMTHYESQASAEKKDYQAIQAILELNEDKLMERVDRYNISMCGVGPVTIVISCAKNLGAQKAELIKYQTSGDITGDYASVVGYAGIIIY